VGTGRLLRQTPSIEQKKIEKVSIPDASHEEKSAFEYRKEPFSTNDVRIDLLILLFASVSPLHRGG
jgi:hypothetical protein